jgi:hypothetical protein
MDIDLIQKLLCVILYSDKYDFEIVSDIDKVLPIGI